MQRALRKREKEVETFGVTFDITTKDEISLRRFVRRVVVRGVRVQLWSVSTRLYRESESERARERESE